MRSGAHPPALDPGVPALDPAVPALDLILDVDRLRGWLAGHGEVLVRRPYLRHKPGTSCVAALRLESGPAYLYAVAELARPKLDKLVHRAPPGAVRAVDPGLRMALAAPAADRDLPAASDLPRAVARLRLSPAADLTRSDVELQTLVHKPQRRLVARLRDTADPAGHEGGVVLRAYRRPQLAAAARGQLVAHQVPGLRTAALLGTSRRYGLMAVAHLPGQSLQAMLAAGTATPAVLEGTGAALARLHTAPVDEDPGPATVSPQARASATLLGRLVPGLRDRLAAVLAALGRTAPVESAPVRCHGDFSTDQVIVDSEGRVGLIDWDRAGVGDQARDVASLEAAGLPRDALAVVLRGYGRVRRPPPHSDWHLAHALLMRVADPFRTGAEGWSGQAEANLTRIEQVLDHAGGHR